MKTIDRFGAGMGAVRKIGLFFAAFWISSGPALAEKRVALVIGNSAYQNVPALLNPARDASAIADSLERLQFRVTRLQDVNAAEMNRAVADFSKVVDGSEMAIVFYAGHGLEAGGENWLIPVDA